MDPVVTQVCNGIESLTTHFLEAMHGMTIVRIHQCGRSGGPIYNSWVAQDMGTDANEFPWNWRSRLAEYSPPVSKLFGSIRHGVGQIWTVCGEDVANPLEHTTVCISQIWTKVIRRVYAPFHPRTGGVKESRGQLSRESYVKSWWERPHRVSGTTSTHPCVLVGFF